MLLTTVQNNHKFHTLISNKPKWRSIRQYLCNDLWIYNNASFIHGKKGEHFHQSNKEHEARHENNKLNHNKFITNFNGNWCTLHYAFNGGRWGSRFQYGLSRDFFLLRDFKNPNQPPSFLKSLICPSRLKPIIRYKIKSEKKLKQKKDILKYLFCHQNQIEHWLSTLLEQHWNVSKTDVAQMLPNNPNEHKEQKENEEKQNKFTVYNVSHWIMQDRHKSFGINHSNSKKNWLKLQNGNIFRCKHTLRFECNHLELTVMLGDEFEITNAANPLDWTVTDFSCFDYIHIMRPTSKWILLSSVTESVLVYHKHVTFQRIKQKKMWDDELLNVSDNYWYGHTLEQMTRILKSADVHPVDIPCGVCYLSVVICIFIHSMHHFIFD